MTSFGEWTEGLVSSCSEGKREFGDQPIATEDDVFDALESEGRPGE
jgi:hypothetical protein